MADGLPLKYVTCLDQVQPFSALAVATRQETRTVDLRRNLALFYMHNPSHFFLRLWSILKDGFVNKYITIRVGEV